jgi:hypothetical protein
MLRLGKLLSEFQSFLGRGDWRPARFSEGVDRAQQWIFCYDSMMMGKDKENG